jgi:hypothetical protein
MHIESVDFKIQPVERKSLYQAQHRLAEEGVNCKRNSTLIQQRNNRVPKHQSHERIHSLNLMLNVLAWHEIERAFGPTTQALAEPCWSTHEHNQGQLSKEIPYEGDPDESLSVRFVYVDTPNPY